MKKLVIDIETVGTPWDELDPYVREYIIKGLSDGDAEEARRAGGLSPFRGRIVAIGVINIGDGRSCALYEVPGQTDVRTEKAGARTYISGTEKQILEKFWGFFDSDSRFISFNGRQFDGPFLMIRSAIHGITPKRDLVGYRYGFHPNCDLREALNFFGTTNSRQFKFNLDLACKVFGVETSKGEGMDGRSVEAKYYAGKHREIADYCLEDVRATAELYEKLASTLLIFNNDFKVADEKDQRQRLADASAVQLPFLSPSESAFMESVTKTSLTLTDALEETNAPAEEAVTSKHSAIILEKLAQTAETEEEIPGGV
ncbi:MAG TPA: ribonuclease H-like domain-containing protein [Thermoanaerobaculia bacterium]|nr:ribonuclease H-like domain-containing protein [Thermoanaerobaculia bacterium]